MGGVAKTVTSIAKNPVGTIKTGLTGSGSALKNLASGKGKLSDLHNVTMNAGTGFSASTWDNSFGGKLFDPMKKPGDPGLGGAGATENPAQALAQSGGASLLANVAMGASVKDTIAGYFGAGDYDKWFANLDEEDQSLVTGVYKQLTSIQSNTNLKNQALQQVVNDFPNIAAQAAKAHQDAGGEFDAVTKDYLDKALSQNAAKYGANGGISSGAQLAAAGRVGADLGLKKLDYMTNREDTSFNQGVQGWQARYNEANALRNFQNLMTQGAAGQGFSAIQSSLNRNAQVSMNNSNQANQRAMQNQQSQDSMFGAIGGVVGTVAGAYFGGPVGAAAGGSVGSQLGSSVGSNVGGTNNTSTPRLNMGGF